MNVSAAEQPTDTQSNPTDLKEIAADVVRRAMQGGATAAEAVAMDGSEFSTVVRLGEVETLKESGSKAIGVRVFFGQRAASTYSSDLTPEGVEQLVDSALTLAKITSEDPFAGIPEVSQLGKLEGDLDLYYDDVYSLSTADRIDYARRAEKAALDADPRIVNSEERHTQLMYTSCGWFFDDISGIETVQVIAYAARVLQLAREVFGEAAAALEPAFLARMAGARSNVAAAGDGAKIYKEQVSSRELNLEQVAAHYAISSIFSSFAEETDLFCFRVWRDSYEAYSSGRGRLALGRVKIVSAITGKQQSFSFAVLHFGDQNITAAVKAYEPEDAAAFEAFASQAAGHVQHGNFPEAIRQVDSYYGHMGYSLTSLFTDEQRRIVQIILNSTLADIEKSLTTIYEEHASLLHYLSQTGLPKPPALTLAAGFAINA